MEYDIQAIQVLRNLVNAETNVPCPKTGFSKISFCRVNDDRVESNEFHFRPRLHGTGSTWTRHQI